MTPSHTEVTISEVGTANRNKLLVKIPRPYHVHLTRITEESVGISKRSGWLRHILDHFAAELRELKQNTTPPSWRSATLNCLIVRAFHCIPDDDEELLKRIFRILALLGDCKGTRRMTESDWICLYQRDLVDSPAFTAGEPEAAVGMTPEVPPQILKQGPGMRCHCCGSLIKIMIKSTAHNRYTAENSRKRKRQESMVPESQTPPSGKDPTPGTQAEDVQYSPYVAGCKWNSRDWTCSYDAVFMTFWTLYEQSSPTWRERWKKHSPKWNTPLSEGFDHLIRLIDNRAKNLNLSFGRYRNLLRDQLAEEDPAQFPRKGEVTAPASEILAVIFGSSQGPSLLQVLMCTLCKKTTEMLACQLRFFPLVSRDINEPSIPLQGALDNFIQHHQKTPGSNGSLCSACGGQNQVGGLNVPDAPWIWFETVKGSKVSISTTVTFDFPPEPVEYTLHSVVYLGREHFTTRFRGRDGQWWNHDGQMFSGAPRRNRILSLKGLLENKGRSACILVYRREYQ